MNTHDFVKERLKETQRLAELTYAKGHVVLEILGLMGNIIALIANQSFRINVLQSMLEEHTKG